jgi:hypothetical protein
MAAHDSMIAARVKQTRSANRKRQAAPFDQGDLVYILSKNIKFEKGLARKLIPKFIGPYVITQDFGNNSFQIDLPANMKQRGIHDVFHVSLLRIHVPNDDRRFPGRLDCQLGIAGDSKTNEWAVDRIFSHHGRCSKALFEVLWKSGDKSWMPYNQAKKLQALVEYLEAIDVSDIKELPHGSGQPPLQEQGMMVASAMTHFWAFKNGEQIEEFTPTKSVSIAATEPNIFDFDYKPPISERFQAYNVVHSALKRLSPTLFRFQRNSGYEPVLFTAACVRVFAEYNITVCFGKTLPEMAPVHYSIFAEAMNDWDNSGFGWAYIEDH